MNALFAQCVSQYTNLRAYARFHVSEDRAQLIRNLFPKALFDEKTITGETFFEIAWSFLSEPKMKTTYYVHDDCIWSIPSGLHRAGGLPAMIEELGIRRWMLNGMHHRIDKDPRTGLILPAEIGVFGFRWLKNGKEHRVDKDLRTGLTLPALISVDETYYWRKKGKFHRDEKDPNTGLMLPAIVNYDRTRECWIDDIKIQ